RIFQKDDEWWVLNLLSTNGTYVNNRKVTDSMLHDGDRIRFGEAEFTFRKPRRNSISRYDWLRNIGRRFLSLFS
ncbi:MAG: FHA domain-containing protein, partial [Arenicellales bacterium]